MPWALWTRWYIRGYLQEYICRYGHILEFKTLRLEWSSLLLPIMEPAFVQRFHQEIRLRTLPRYYKSRHRGRFSLRSHFWVAGVLDKLTHSFHGCLVPFPVMCFRRKSTEQFQGTWLSRETFVRCWNDTFNDDDDHDDNSRHHCNDHFHFHCYHYCHYRLHVRYHY